MTNIENLAIDELEEIAKTHPRTALQTAYGEGVLAGINQAKALQSSEPVATAVYEIYAGLDNWREVSKAEYDDYKRTKRMLVPANANDFCYAELQSVYDEMYVHKDVARVANQLYKLIHSRTLPPSTVSLEEHNKRIAELEARLSSASFLCEKIIRNHINNPTFKGEQKVIKAVESVLKLLANEVQS